MEYFQRISDVLLRERLETLGAVLIEGPKWCGKTTTAEQQAKSIIQFQDPDERERYDGIAANRPSLFLKGDTPRLIDEWQDYPVVWDAIRLEVDKRQTPGQFILTGSNVVDQSQIRHSGTGRISRMRMLPMSLWESHESNGEVSLRELFNNPNMDIETESQLSIDDLIYAVCRGGWPAAVIAQNHTHALSVARDYVQSVCDSDISRVDKTQRNPKLAKQILRSYARNISIRLGETLCHSRHRRLVPSYSKQNSYSQWSQTRILRSFHCSGTTRTHTGINANGIQNTRFYL